MACSLSPRRLLKLFVVMSTLCLMAVASAATLNGVDSDDLAVGAASILECDPDGVTVTHITTLTTVTDLSITGIDATCIGGDLTVTLTAGDDSDDGTAKLNTTARPFSRWLPGIEVHQVAVHPRAGLEHLPVRIIGRVTSLLVAIEGDVERLA